MNTDTERYTMTDINTPEPTPVNTDQVLKAATEQIKADRSNSFRHRATLGAVAGIASVAVGMAVEKLFNARLDRAARREARQVVKTIEAPKPIEITETPTNNG